MVELDETGCPSRCRVGERCVSGSLDTAVRSSTQGRALQRPASSIIGAGYGCLFSRALSGELG